MYKNQPRKFVRCSNGLQHVRVVLLRLCVSQVSSEDPDIGCHHRHDDKDNQVFHFYFVSLGSGKISRPPSGCNLRSLSLGHGCPHWSQLQPACASVSRICAQSNATSFNISVAVSGPSFNNRVVFISAPLLVQTTAVTIAPLGVDWLLLCKNCASSSNCSGGKNQGQQSRTGVC